jgi:hypothetical protein
MAEDLSSAHTGIGGYSGGGAGSKQQERKMTKKEMVHCAKKLPYLVGEYFLNYYTAIVLLAL